MLFQWWGLYGECCSNGGVSMVNGGLCMVNGRVCMVNVVPMVESVW